MPEVLVQSDGDPRSILERWVELCDEIPEDWKILIPETGRFFSLAVDLLRNPVTTPHHGINKLMANLWRLVGNKIVPAALIAQLPFGYDGLFFWAEPGQDLAAIMIPQNWLQKVSEDRWMQMGGLVFTAVQANDFWHGKIVAGESKNSEARSCAWEAEFLWHLTNTPGSNFTANEYQQKLMKDYPNGLASLDPALRYEIQPFAKEDFDLIDQDKAIV